MNSKLCILILAAGASTRMKKAKQLLPWGNTSLVNHVIETALESRATETYVVLGASYEAIHEKIKDKKVSIVFNENFESGIASSIRVGVKEILKTKQPLGVLIMLGDQPFVRSEYLNEMIEAFAANNIGVVCSNYGNTIGVPVIFGAEYFNELLELRGDRGATTIISKYKEKGIILNPGIAVQDIDTMEDYIKYRPD